MEKPTWWNNTVTVPNLLSLLRLVMIPGIVLCYSRGQRYAAAGLVALSGLTDVADGIIARHFDQVTDLGKILDPVADKLTQGALIGCMIPQYRNLLWLLLLFTAKEAAMAVSGLAVLRKKALVHSAQWFGKLTTFVLWLTIMLLFLVPGLPRKVVNFLILACAGSITGSFGMYMAFYATVMKEKKEE